MTDIVIIVIVLAIIGAAVGYVIRAKKRGVKCIGCPNGCKCSGRGKCSGCSGEK